MKASVQRDQEPTKAPRGYRGDTLDELRAAVKKTCAHEIMNRCVLDHVVDPPKQGILPRLVWQKIAATLTEAENLVKAAEGQTGDLYLQLVRAFVEATAGAQERPWRAYLGVTTSQQPDSMGSRAAFFHAYDKSELWKGQKPTDRDLACLWLLDDENLPDAHGPTVAQVLDRETRAMRETRHRAAR